MPAQRISMRKIKEVLRLRYSSHFSIRQIAASLSLSRGTVNNYLMMAQAARISWPLPDELDESTLSAMLFGIASTERINYAAPDFLYIHNELKRKGVTLQLLWEEYVQTHPVRAYKYSRFCELYQHWSQRLKTSLRQTHRAGEKMFVDYAGPTVPIHDFKTNEIRQAQIFVAVLGASNYAYAEASWTQTLPDWIAAHTHAFTFFAGVPEIIIPDNLRSGINRACRYEPDLNPTYAEMASYYGTAVMPARPAKPKDKAKVENCVLLVERWILARLRNRQFSSLAELNKAIREHIDDLNNRPFKKLPGSRRSQYELLDKPALKPLPDQPFEYATWKKIRVGIDYHVEIDGHYYSVPHNLIKKQVEARATSSTVELLFHGKRVASHPRSYERGGQTTLFEHMPKAHQKYLEWTPKRLLDWAAATGPYTASVVKYLLENRPHPEQGFRSSRGLVSLSRQYGATRLEAACQRAIIIGSPSYQSVGNILKAGLDRAPLDEETWPEILDEHENVRGAAYYKEIDDSQLIN